MGIFAYIWVYLGIFENKREDFTPPVTNDNSALRILSWFNNLGSRHCSKTGWGRGHRFTDSERKRFESCKLDWKLLLGEVAGYRNKPCPNQMTGYLADRMFAENQREAFVEKIAKLWQKFRKGEMPTTMKDVYLELLQRFAVIRRVVAADRCIREVFKSKKW